MRVASMYNAGEVSKLAAKPRVERESALWTASEKYMCGEITLDDLKNVERPYVCLEYAKSVGAPYNCPSEGRPHSFLDALIQFFKPS
jgi:hypothetical protein